MNKKNQTLFLEELKGLREDMNHNFQVLQMLFHQHLNTTTNNQQNFRTMGNDDFIQTQICTNEVDFNPPIIKSEIVENCESLVVSHVASLQQNEDTTTEGHETTEEELDISGNQIVFSSSLDQENYSETVGHQETDNLEYNLIGIKLENNDGVITDSSALISEEKTDSKEFTNNYDVVKQLGSKTKDNSFKCNFCLKSFNCPRLLQSHLSTHNTDKLNTCNNFNTLTQSSSLKSHFRTQTGEKSFECQYCHKNFARSNNLTSHIRTHTGEKPFNCEYCHRSFSQSSSLKSHVMIHTGEKPFECNNCHKTFARSSTLKIHIRTHTGEKPFNCEYCHKMYAHYCSLRSHLLIHTKEKPFECKYCYKSFSQSCNLKSHLLIHTREK